MTLSAQTFSKWPKVRFGDVVRNVDESVRDPQTCGLERYVGLEHIDPESLHIQRWGLIAEGTTFTRRIRKGQVLFGKRRAYQRKVAVAEFDGLCSSDILVFEPKDDRLLPELLPFICQTEGFFEHALDTSAGSLSPRTKFKELVRYEFPLPPLDEQKRLAMIFNSFDEVNTKWIVVTQKIEIYLNTFLVDLFTQANSWQLETLSAHVASSAYGPRFSNEFYSDQGNLAVIRTTDLLDDGTIIYETTPKVGLSPDSFKEHLLQPGDFMISRSGTCGIACVYEEQSIQMIPGAFLIRFRLNPSLNPYFLKEFLNSPAGRELTEKIAQGAVQKNIRGSLLLEQIIPVPKISEQNQVLKTINEIRGKLNRTRRHLESTKNLQKLYLNRIMSS